MSYTKYFISIMTLITLQFEKTDSITNTELVIRKTGIETLSPCAVGLILFADVNNTSNDVDFEVEVTPDECCVGEGRRDCNVIEVVGNCVETIPRGTIKRLRLVAPMIEPFERNGFCTLHLDSKPKNRQRGMMRDTVKIPFDTHLRNTEQLKEIPDNVTECKNIDEDPLNDCMPVDCETYYNGRRSYFDNRSKRCTNVPSCISDDAEEEIPNVIYDFTKNKCISGKSLSDSDVDLIKELTGGKKRKPKDILIIKNIKPTPNNMLPTLNTMMMPDMKSLKNITKQLSDLPKKDYVIKFDTCKVKKIKDFIYKKWTCFVFGGVILFQCCLISTMVYCMGKRCTCGKQKKVVRKFYNYRQDASVTTPLICTSNNDTETTEFQYMSESSNINKKIKCYKACQKERQNNVKMSMSDDIILSKCVTRRDWNSKPAKSEAIPEIIPVKDNRRDTIETLNKYNASTYEANLSSQFEKHSDVKVNFENEEQKPKKGRKHNKIVKSIVKRMESIHSRRGSKDYKECESEKEIKCHSYNYTEANSNLTGFKPSSNSKKLGFFKTDRNKKGTVSMSTEKEAQASFSIDSIDDFLSEKGLIYLADDISKYSLSNACNNGNPSSLSSEVSSKTSKNNVVKNVLSLLHRRSKHGLSSDPGVKKSSNVDMELIHMSHASIYSSNNDSDYVRNLKITRDSRSSL